MRHDRRADVVVGAKPADVIEMRVRADQPADRLVRRELRDLLDDGEAALFAARRFEHGDEIAELHHVAVRRSAAEQVHAVRHFLDRDERRVRRLRLFHRFGNRNRIVTHVGLDVRELAAVRVVAGALRVELPVVVPALMRVPVDRPLRRPGRHELGRLLLDVEIAEHVLVHRRLEPRDDVLAVDRRVDAKLSEHRDADDVHALRGDDVAVAPFLDLFPSPERLRVGARHARRLEKSVRVHPDVELIDIGHLRRNRQRARRRRRCATRIGRSRCASAGGSPAWACRRPSRGRISRRPGCCPACGRTSLCSCRSPS